MNSVNSRSVSSWVSPDSQQSLPGALACRTEALRNVRTNVLGRRMIKSQLAAKIVGNRNQVGLRPLHNRSRARAFKAEFGKNLHRYFDQPLAGSFAPVLAGRASNGAFDFCWAQSFFSLFTKLWIDK